MERLLQGGIDEIEENHEALMAVPLLARHSRTTLTSLGIRLESFLSKLRILESTLHIISRTISYGRGRLRDNRCVERGEGREGPMRAGVRRCRSLDALGGQVGTCRARAEVGWPAVRVGVCLFLLMLDLGTRVRARARVLV